jgi:hypothetical protein
MYNPARLSDMSAVADMSDFCDSVVLSRILTAELRIRLLPAEIRNGRAVARRGRCVVSGLL